MQVDEGAAGTQPASMSVGEAIKSARRPLTQSDLADRMAIDQGTVSRWERGQRLSFDIVLAVDEALSRPRGTLLIEAGLIEGIGSVEAAIAADKRLTARARRRLRDAYAEAVAESARERTARRRT